MHLHRQAEVEQQKMIILKINFVIVLAFCIMTIRNEIRNGRNSEKPEKRNGLSDMTDEEILMCIAVDDEWD